MTESDGEEEANSEMCYAMQWLCNRAACRISGSGYNISAVGYGLGEGTGDRMRSRPLNFAW